MRGLSKKATIAAIAASMLMQSGGVFAKIPADVEGTRFEEPIRVLAALGIMIGDENGNYRPDDTIIRSEVAKMAVHAMGLESAADSASGQTKFPDVASNHWASGYIKIASDMGIVIGDDKGNFRPNDTITYAEAMTIMVRALGYEPAAQKKGGFPSGYVLTASENGLANKVEGATHSPITRGNVAYLTVNSLEAKMMEQTSFGSNPEYSVVDKTLMEDRLKVTKHEGQVVAIPNSGISGESNISEGKVQIGEHIYDTAYNMNNLLGYNVTYYVRDEDKASEEIILALPTNGKNKTLTVSADLFEGISSKNGKKTVEYFEKEGTSKTKTAEISDKAKLVYNGKHSEMSDELLNIADKSGYVSLLDTDKDGVYDIVFVTVYKNIVVDTVSANGKITDKYDGGVLKLDENVEFRLEKGLEEIEISQLSEYDVLSVAESLDKKLYTITVTNQSINGKISASDENGVYINGKHFKIAANYKRTLEIGTEGTFYTDVEGKIAAVDTSAQLSSNYAYMMRAYSTDDDVVRFKLYTKDGKETVVEALEKIRFNGNGGKKALDVLNSMKDKDGNVASGLVTYSLNSEGKLSGLNIAKDNSETGKYDLSAFTLNYKLENAVYNEAQKKIGNIRINDNTVIFNIPSGTSDSAEYSIANLDMFEDEEKYDVLVYDRTEDYTAKAIVVTNARFNANADSPIAVVKKLGEGTNENDEVGTILNAYADGKEINLFTSEADVFEKDGGRKLQAGDIIQYKLNNKGEVASIRVLMDISDKSEEKKESPVENLDIVYGKVIKKFSSSVNVTVNGGEIMNYALPKDVLVYSIDTTVSKNKVTIAETSDIQSYDESEENRIFIKLYKDVVKEVVIVK